MNNLNIADDGQISEDDFYEYFKPIANHIDKNAAYDGFMFETFGTEFDFVLSKFDESVIWTIIEGDDGVTICAGLHWVNRIGYIISTLPYSRNDLYLCDL